MSQFLLPDLGEGLEEAQLVQWLVQVGDAVQLNQAICQVETAKALVDIPSPFAGTVRALHAQPGDTVPVGAPLITIEQGNGTTAAATSSEEQPPMLVGYGAGGPPQTFSRRRRGADHGAVAATASAPAPAVATSPSAPTGERESKASPLVRKMAQERGIDLSTIRGTGPADVSVSKTWRTPALPRLPHLRQPRRWRTTRSASARWGCVRPSPPR